MQPTQQPVVPTINPAPIPRPPVANAWQQTASAYNRKIVSDYLGIAETYMKTSP